MTPAKDYAMKMSKEIIIAKLSTSSPDRSDAETGEEIGKMFEAVYNKIYEIALKNHN